MKVVNSPSDVVELVRLPMVPQNGVTAKSEMVHRLINTIRDFVRIVPRDEKRYPVITDWEGRNYNESPDMNLIKELPVNLSTELSLALTWLGLGLWGDYGRLWGVEKVYTGMAIRNALFNSMDQGDWEWVTTLAWAVWSKTAAEPTNTDSFEMQAIQALSSSTAMAFALDVVREKEGEDLEEVKDDFLEQFNLYATLEAVIRTRYMVPCRPIPYSISAPWYMSPRTTNYSFEEIFEMKGSPMPRDAVDGGNSELHSQQWFAMMKMLAKLTNDPHLGPMSYQRDWVKGFDLLTLNNVNFVVPHLYRPRGKEQK